MQLGIELRISYAFYRIKTLLHRHEPFFRNVARGNLNARANGDCHFQLVSI